jgi:KDO2-lipid IV(A) lauroyltransferase
MPWEMVNRFGSAFAAFAYDFIPIRKKLTLDNLRHAFPLKSPEEIEAIARGAYRNVVIALLEIFWFPRITADKMKEIVSASDSSIMDAKLKEGKGLIMLGAHFGNWELNALAVALFGRHQLTIIVQRQRNKFVDEFMSRNRVLFGSRLVEIEKSPREIFAALRKNEVVAMLADQSGPQEGLFVDFFGRPASTHKGPAVFSVRTGAPIVMSFILRQGDGRYTVEYEEVDTRTLSGSENDKISQLTARHVAVLEKYVTRYPDHWLWMHKRWKHTPPAHPLTEQHSHEATE